MLLLSCMETRGQGDKENYGLELWDPETLEQLKSGIWNSIFFPTFGNPFSTTPALWITKFCN